MIEKVLILLIEGDIAFSLDDSYKLAEVLNDDMFSWKECSWHGYFYPLF